MHIRIIVHLGFLATLATFLLAWDQAGARPPDPLLLGRAALASNGSAVPAEFPRARAADAADAAVYVHDRGFVYEVDAPARSVMGVLAAAGIETRPADRIYPARDDAVSDGQHIYVQRAKQTSIDVDNVRRTAFTFAETVGALLQEARVELAPSDRVEPSVDSPIRDAMAVQVTRIRQRDMVVDIQLPFETVTLKDGDLEFGVTQIEQEGEHGLKKQQVSAVYQDGVEVSRTLVREWVVVEPKTKQVRLGAKIVPQAALTADGPIEYAAKLTVLATWYSPSNAGVSPLSPSYGISKSGLPVQKGIIAVDPRVIPLGTRLYVPGYGYGIAADTGGGIVGNMIDLGYADDDVHDWVTRTVEIYTLP